MMQRPNPSSLPNQHLNPSLIHHFASPPIPPISPHSQIPATLQLKQSRSISFDDSLPGEQRNDAAGGMSPSLPPSPFTMYHSISRVGGENLPPRKSHRRSNSDVVTFAMMMPPQTPNSPISGGGQVSHWSNLVKEEPRQGGRTSERESMDDILRAYMNLDNIGKNTVEVEMESSGGTRKTNGGNSTDSEGGDSSDNVKVSSGVKRRAGEDIAPTNRHYRSVSMDSCFMGKLNLCDDKLPPLSSAKVSPTNSGGEGNSNAYRVEFGKSEFSAAEMKRISADAKLAEIVMVDPKRVKRILANRLSAARSKDRKAQYTAELEHKVQTLQNETTSLSAQLTHLQRDSMGLANQNNEIKFRLQAMEQQAQLRNALSEKLIDEVQRLRLVIGERSRSSESKTSLNPEMFQQQLRISQLQLQHSNQNTTMKENHASNE